MGPTASYLRFMFSTISGTNIAVAVGAFRECRLDYGGHIETLSIEVSELLCPTSRSIVSICHIADVSASHLVRALFSTSTLVILARPRMRLGREMCSEERKCNCFRLMS